MISLISFSGTVERFLTEFGVIWVRSVTCSPAGHCESMGKQDIQQNCVPSSHMVARACLQSKAEAEGEAGDELNEGQRFDREWVSFSPIKKSPNLTLKMENSFRFTVSYYFILKRIFFTLALSKKGKQTGCGSHTARQDQFRRFSLLDWILARGTKEKVVNNQLL